MRAVNLIPEDQRAGGAGVAGRSNGAAYAVLALVGGLALLALLYGLADRQVTSRKAQAASLNARAQQAQTAAAALAPYTNFVSLREEREHAVSQLVDSRFDWAHAFHELGRVLPKDASITTLTGTVGTGKPGSGGSIASSSPPASASGSSGGSSSVGAGGAGASSSTASSATPPGSVPVFLLAGCATSQSEVALMLQRLRLVDGVSEVALQSSTKPAAGGGSGEAGCPARDPAFSVQITFAALPASPLPGTSTARLTSSTGGAG